MLAYLILAVVLGLGGLSAFRPTMVRRSLTWGRTYGLSDRYWQHFDWSLRLVGMALVFGVVALTIYVVALLSP